MGLRRHGLGHEWRVIVSPALALQPTEFSNYGFILHIKHSTLLFCIRKNMEPQVSRDPYYLTPAWRALRTAALARDRGCIVCGAPTVVVDHIVSRRMGGPDTLANLRCLCRTHDNQVKEGAAGARRSGGRFSGCRADGSPLDPGHWWAQPRVAENLSSSGARNRTGGQSPESSPEPRRGRR
jgi:hypothetical protein